MLLVNQILHNRYRILRQLGHGGMGAVYEAYDSVFETTVALKEIMIDLSKSSNPKQQEMILRAFEREAKILAKIKHEVVPHVRDYFTDGNCQFLVMELVEGKDLGGLLEERQSPFPLEDVLRWTDQLLDGLDYLHTQNPPIFHRDLKPQNLKITPRGKIKLLDFGIAKGGAEPPNSTTINNQTFVAATLNYSPIEQIFRVLDPVFREVLMQRFEKRIIAVMQQNADARSDIYALGATVYHLLTGQLPIDALKRTLEVWSNKPDPLTNPISLNRRIPPEIANLLLKAMEIDHGRRFASALEMQQALHDAQQALKVREASQMETTMEIDKPSRETLLAEQERLRQLEAQQQQTRLGGAESYQNAPTQQISAGQMNPAKPPVSEETIQGGGLGYSQNYAPQTGGQSAPPSNPFNTGGGNIPPQTPFNTGGAPQTPFNTGGQPPFNTGGQPPFNTGGQNPSGNLQQPTEMAGFAAGSTSANAAQPNSVPNQFAAGTVNSNNPLQPNQAFANHYAAAPPAKKKSRKIFWILPLLMLFFVGVAGAGVGLWWWQQHSGDGGNTNTNPSPAASPTPSASTTASPDVSPSPNSNVNSATAGTPTPTATPAVKSTVSPIKPNIPPQTPLQPGPNKKAEPNARPKKKVSVDDIINDTE
ncbi:MAG: protein kinase [Acidobacteria bacterium]|nr:protein kinase [Acidobacteriota bacterium]